MSTENYFFPFFFFFGRKNLTSTNLSYLSKSLDSLQKLGVADNYNRVQIAWDIWRLSPMFTGA